MGTVPKPPHQDDRVEAGLGDQGGYFPDEASAQEYAAIAVKSEYGRDRVRAVKSLIDDLPLAGAFAIDFGGGDGSLLSELGIGFSAITLIDVAPRMLDLAPKFIVSDSLTTLLGSIERLAELEDGSCDVVFCINAINYLEPREHVVFFSEAHRLLKQGGHLIVMTGNELLDMFALNSGTSDFFDRNFGADVSELLLLGSQDRWRNAGRFNPLSFGAVVQQYGFREVKQAFAQWHQTPPGLAVLRADGDLRSARLAARDHGFDPNSLPSEQRWQALFQCSMFASLCVKD